MIVSPCYCQIFNGNVWFVSIRMGFFKLTIKKSDNSMMIVSPCYYQIF